MKLSVVLATYNEEDNIGDCIKSVKDIADEIIVFDEFSSDKTKELAEKLGAAVYEVKHEPIFHITKQKALDKAKSEWILQLDADERVTPALAREVVEVINMSDIQIRARKIDKEKMALFRRHLNVIENRDGKIGKKTGEIVAFFIPRMNFFLGKPLVHAGVYPDASIRLIKKGKARFPAKSVHEIMQVDGEVAWLENDLEHHDSPTFSRYLLRLNRYTDLHAKELANKKVGKNLLQFINYSFILPFFVFIKLFLRHRGFLDGMRGFVWSLFSAMHYPIAYFKYWQL